MALPGVFDLTLPLLRMAATGEVKLSEAVTLAADQIGLSNEERSELLASGRTTKFASRIYFAKVRLGMAHLVETTRPGYFRATPEGLAVLAKGPARIDHKFLMGVEPYRAARERFTRRAGASASPESPAEDVEGDPAATIEKAVLEIQQALADDLLRRVMQLSPAGFELLVIRLMQAMGYGRSEPEATRHLGRSGDGGIDGVKIFARLPSF